MKKSFYASIYVCATNVWVSHNYTLGNDMALMYKVSQNSLPNQLLAIHNLESVRLIRCLFLESIAVYIMLANMTGENCFWDTQLERLIWNLFNILSVLQLVIFFSLEVTFQCSCLQDILYDLTFHHHLTFTNLTTLCLD